MSAMHTTPPQTRLCLAQRGTGLIELMISIAIGLVIVAAMIALFVNINRTNSEMAKANSQIENGRFAIQLLEIDMMHAGFWGTHTPQFDDLTLTTPPTDVPSEIPNPCLTYGVNWTSAHKNNLIGIPLQTYDTVSDCSSLITNKLASSDILVVRHAETCVPSTGSCAADSSGKLYFQSSLCSTVTTPYILDTSGYTLLNRNCTTTAEKRKFISNLYYIRNYSVTAGDGIPTLMRSEFDLASSTLSHQPAQPLIEGIEGFRVELGIDNISDTGNAVNYTAAINWTDPTNLTSPSNRGDGIPDGPFIRCTAATPCTAAQLSNVVAAKLYVLARSKEPSPGYTDTKTYQLGSTTLGPYNDNFKRHVFSTTLRLASIAARRETP